MAFGGALSFNGIDASIAAGAVEVPEIPATPELPAIPAIPAIPPIKFPSVSITAVDCLGALELTVTFDYSIPLPDVSLNVTVNGYSMTANTNGFGDLNITGDLGLTKEECNPVDGFSVPTVASAKNVLVNGLRAALPDIPPLTMPPIIDKAKMAMKTLTDNVLIYY